MVGLDIEVIASLHDEVGAEVVFTVEAPTGVVIVSGLGTLQGWSAGAPGFEPHADSYAWFQVGGVAHFMLDQEHGVVELAAYQDQDVAGVVARYATGERLIVRWDTHGLPPAVWLVENGPS